MKLLILTMVMVWGPFTMAADSAPLEQCAFDLAKRILTIVKSTVGLHSETQVEGTVGMVKMVCVEKEQLASGLSDQTANEVINRAVSRALVDVFQSMEL